MRATELLTRQCGTVNGILHDLADDLTPDELVTRAVPNTNLIGFDLWHVARTQDFALQTLVLGVPELIDEPRWADRGRLVTHGIGVGFTQEEADDLARTLTLADILEYADAVHQALITWLGAQSDGALDQQPDVLTHIQRYPVYQSDAMREEVPWMYVQPPAWRCLSPGIYHVRDHLVVIELLKAQVRAHQR